MTMVEKKRAPRNKTLTVGQEEYKEIKKQLFIPDKLNTTKFENILNKTIIGDTLTLIKLMPDEVFDLIIIDPPYNLSKDFNGLKFKSMNDNEYLEYLREWFSDVVNKLKPTGSLYLCGDWKNTAMLYQVMSENLYIKNRITWQREKGRGAKTNWKNAMEDIWFGTKHEKNYYFDVDAVKVKRKVLAPYKVDGKPKDWEETDAGNYRITYPSNFWDDISIPYWSMPENTDHPTQKPEKLIAKLILASCPRDGVVFDPFLGSGTTSIVAKKLNRKYVGLELNEEYAVWAEKRLLNVDLDRTIQGYSDGVFWERNSLSAQKKNKRKHKEVSETTQQGLSGI